MKKYLDILLVLTIVFLYMIINLDLVMKLRNALINTW